LRIRGPHVTAMLEHARRGYPFEVCGVLLGERSKVATIVPASDISKIAKKNPPKAGTSRTELLKGGDYYRVWINKSGTNYIINLPTS